MSSVKAALKAAKSALDKGAFEEAESQARKVLEEDKDNYFATVFLGRALEQQSKLEEAAGAYSIGTKIKPQDELAWKGLCNAYEKQGARNLEEHTKAAIELAKIYVRIEDREKCQTTVDGLVSFAKEYGSRAQYKNALRAYLPDHDFHDFLEGRVPNPGLTYLRLAEITEADEKEKINKEVGERRTRLGAKLGQVQIEVKREVYRNSELEELYQKVIDWSNDDEERRRYEEKLLEHAYDNMGVLLIDDKVLKRRKVQELAHGMAIIKHPYKLAWDIELEWRDVDDVSSLDRNVLLEYIQYFPKSGLSRVLQGHLGLKYAPKKDKDKDAEAQPEDFEQIGPDDALLLIDDGVSESSQSAFAHRIVSDFYLRLEEYESCADACRKGQKLLQKESEKCGLRFEVNLDTIRSNLGTSLVYYQAPKNHPEAQAIFNDVLKGNPLSTPALLGIGLIYEEQQNYDQAYDFLNRVLARDPANIRVGAEAAWCNALRGDLEGGLNKLQHCHSKLEADKHSPRDLRAQVAYRVGKCLWDLHSDKASRRNRHGPYAFFIAAIRANPSYAPAYTSLGVFYAQHTKDRKRARQCYQKAFELSATETAAAEQLARSFAKDADWDIVEAVAQRVIDSGVVKNVPGSKRRAPSWPFAAMGVVYMNKQQYGEAVQSYQSALRIAPHDYHSWVGLGESYLSSGRYNAASKALEHSLEMDGDENLEADRWFPKYMYANVHRELGDFDTAIRGYQDVLNIRPKDFGVSGALLQTLVESANDSVSQGSFRDASSNARAALSFALELDEQSHRTVNFWKAIGDACLIYAAIPQSSHDAHLDISKNFVGHMPDGTEQEWIEIRDVDQVSQLATSSEGASTTFMLAQCLRAGLLAQKLAVYVASRDAHAQAVAWYNLGWTEYQASKVSDSSDDKAVRADFGSCVLAAVKCFKKAIELEASNTDFWNALGVVTTSLNPQIAQHSLVRSLHLNERSPRAWTNLGVLYLTLEDSELAHEAFSRAQSTDPDCVNAWLGEGLIAMRLGDFEEARSHFAHAFDIADASDVAVKQHYTCTTFDHMIVAASANLTDLMSPIFALQQIQSQTLNLLPYKHLLALMLERASNYESAVGDLSDLNEQVEAIYEVSESATILGQLIRLKNDLARTQLAARAFEEAKENAHLAIDLSETVTSDVLSQDQRRTVRLSAHLVAGMAQYHLDDLSNAIAMFRAALEESGDDPDVVCLLAQVLWAKGGNSEKTVAKEQLFDAIEKHEGHVDASMVLGALSLVDGDDQTNEAVMSDLPTLRVSERLQTNQTMQIDKLQIMASKLHGDEVDIASEIQRITFTDPSKPLGWFALSEETENTSIAETALFAVSQSIAASQQVASASPQFAEALADVGRAAEAQRAAVLCPWLTCGWTSLQNAQQASA